MAHSLLLDFIVELGIQLEISLSAFLQITIHLSDLGGVSWGSRIWLELDILDFASQVAEHGQNLTVCVS